MKLDLSLIKAYNNLYTKDERKEMIAKNLQILRKQANLQKAEVAEYLGIGAQAYGAYESGRNEPPAEILVRVSLLYNVPLDFIMLRDNMAKSQITVADQIRIYDEQAALLKENLLKGDSETQKQFENFTKAIVNLTEAIKGRKTGK